MRCLDLFSGIGGMALGLERAGIKAAAFCEIEPFPQKVLRKHWPDVPIYSDVTKLTREVLYADGVIRDGAPIDLIAGGFPCQDLSYAGKGAGIEGARSGLWSEFHRLICEIRPRFVLVENVSALLARGLDRVLGDLAASGYDAEWDCVPASAVGAPHRRDRLFIVAYPYLPDGEARSTHRVGAREQAEPPSCDGSAEHVADAQGKGLERRVFGGNAWPQLTGFREGCRAIAGQWGIEPGMGRVAHGIPRRVDRLKGLGNAVVPQVAEYLGQRIMAAQTHKENLKCTQSPSS